jgi:hypothetical protein
MLRATIVWIDGSPLIEDAEIQVQRAKRGSGDGVVWRGHFLIPPPMLRPTLGETIEVHFGSRPL